jgi:hypothetical protein
MIGTIRKDTLITAAIFSSCSGFAIEAVFRFFQRFTVNRNILSHGLSLRPAVVTFPGSAITYLFDELDSNLLRSEEDFFLCIVPLTS